MLTLLLLPVAIQAEDYDIRVGAVQVTSENAHNVMGDDLTDREATVTFDPVNNILTLNGADIDMSQLEGYPVESGIANLTVHLKGYNMFTLHEGALNAFYNTNATAEGTLTFTTEASAENYSYGQLYVSGIYQYSDFASGYVVSNSIVENEGETGWYVREDGTGSSTYKSVSISYVEYYQIWQGGVQLSSSQLSPASGGTTYIPTTHTLLLVSYGYYDSFRSGMDELIVELRGDSYVKSFIYTGEGQGRIVFRADPTSQSVNRVNINDTSGETGAISGFAEVVFEEPLVLNTPETAPDTWDANTTTVVISDLDMNTLFGGGDGSEANPYIISTPRALILFSQFFNDGQFNIDCHVELGDDIDCASTGGFMPIGASSDGPFQGNFNGKWHKISNLDISYMSNFTGFIGMLGWYDNEVPNCRVEKLILDNCTINGSSTIGAIVGSLESGIVDSCYVNSCAISTSSYGGAEVGGLVGKVADGTVSHCKVTGNTPVSVDCSEGDIYIGAIVGNNQNGTLEDNIYEYTVTTTITSNDQETVKEGYETRGTGNYLSDIYGYDILDNNGAVLYTQPLTIIGLDDNCGIEGVEGYAPLADDENHVYYLAPGKSSIIYLYPEQNYYTQAVLSYTPADAIEPTTTPLTNVSEEEGSFEYSFDMPDAETTFTVTISPITLKVGSVIVTADNAADVLGNGTVSFNTQTSTLTLNGANIEGGIYSALEDDFTVYLLGENVIDGGYESEDVPGECAFVASGENVTLTFTTDDENPGQLLMKRTNRIDEVVTYYSGFIGYPDYENNLGCVSEDYKRLIAAVPVMTPEEGLYWTDQQYTISGPQGETFMYRDGMNHFGDMVYDEPFTLETAGKYLLTTWRSVIADDTEFILNGDSRLYFVHDKPTFSVEGGTYNDTQNITITNMPEQTGDGYPQVWYYLGENVNDSVLYTSADQPIEITESTKVCVYILDKDSDKVFKSKVVESEYTILPKTNLNISYAQNSREWASYYTDEKNLEKPEGLEVYVVTEATEAGVTVQEIDFIPKSQAVLLKRVSENVVEPIAAKEYLGELPAIDAEPAEEWTGTDEQLAVSSLLTNGAVYVLYNDGFTRATKGSIPANRGFLVLTTDPQQARLAIIEEGESTDIVSIQRPTDNVQSYYNLNGQRVDVPQKNKLYIVNGKKTIIK